MEDSAGLLLQVYERALEQLRAFDARIAEQLGSLIGTHAIPTARDVAFLEGLRRERDEALSRLRDAEASLFNYLLTRLGLSSQSMD